MVISVITTTKEDTKVAALRSDLAFGERYERAAAEIISEKIFPMATTLVKAGTYADIDWLIVSAETGEFIAALEVKARRIAFAAYPEAIISKRKHLAARFLREFFKIPTYAGIVYPDAVATFSLEDTPLRIENVFARGGRAVEHCFYATSAFDLHPDLLNPIQQRSQQ